jgi:hypothetical protein
MFYPGRWVLAGQKKSLILNVADAMAYIQVATFSLLDFSS